MAVTSCCKTLFWRNVNKCLFNADRAATAQRKNSTQVWPGSPVSLLGLLFIGVTQVDVLLKRSPQHSQNLHPWNCPSQLSDSCTQRVLSMFHSLYSYPAGLGRHGPDSHEPLTFLPGECIHLEETAPWCIWQRGHLRCLCLTPGSSNVQACPEKGLFHGKAPTELKRKRQPWHQPAHRFRVRMNKQRQLPGLKKALFSKKRCKEKERKLMVEENFRR